MGQHSKIEWTDHTFNPWVGCTKVSPGCAHCYAERDMDQRRGFARWGKGQPRVRTSPGNWRTPLRWDRIAGAKGTRERVFCASLADVFDDEAPVSWRDDLWSLIAACRNLDWLLLTKRPQNIRDFLPASWGDGSGWSNVWLGTTVEDQQRADERIPHLQEIPARVRFLSCEPLLGPVDLAPYLVDSDVEGGFPDQPGFQGKAYGAINWVIAGGESGPHARPMSPTWARSLRDQCQAAGVPFLFKQWGEWLPLYRASPCLRWSTDGHGECIGARVDGVDYGPDRIEIDGEGMAYVRVGKRAAGRHLGGVTWDEMPAARS